MSSVGSILLTIAPFVLGWVCINYLLSAMSGWRRLAKCYKAENSPPAHRTATYGRVGGVRYTHSLRVSVSEQGLHLSTALPFRFASPTLFIPWTQVSVIGIIERRLFGRMLKLEVRLPSPVELQLPERVLEGRPHDVVAPGSVSKASS